MAIAAVPDYLGKDFRTASPGMRFGMFVPMWDNQFIKLKESTQALRQATKLNDNDKQTMQALLERQRLAFANSQGGLVIEAVGTAPFATGLGNEHPTENGFAFLSPYGLPYLPGSGIKGVVRQAARELASGEWGDTCGWDEAAITALFGRETADGDTDQLRGALIFWDVIPQLKGDQLEVEVMTPHQKHYYQDGQSPHDSGQPIPIFFLTVPTGSAFAFHVQCNSELLAIASQELQNSWQGLLQAAFEHAFDWLGFGAKTAVGYGAMADTSRQAERMEAAKQRQLEQEAQAREASLKEAGIAMGAELWSGALLKEVSPGSGEITVTSADGSKTAQGKFYSQLSAAAKKRFKNKRPVRLDVDVEIQGNLVTIKAVRDAAQ